MGIVRFALRFPHTFYVVAALIVFLGVIAVRGRGLWAGVDIDPALATGRRICERLLDLGVLAKDTHGSTIRLAPPLVITEAEVDWALEALAEALRSV